MFTKPLTRAPRYILNRFELSHDLSHKFLKYYEAKLHFKSASLSTDNCRTSRMSSFYNISNH